MNNKHFLLIAIIILSRFSISAQEFILESELKTTYGGSGSHATFTNYTYDSNGNRINKRVYDGGDTLSNLLSHCEYVYDVNGKVTKETLVSSNDTLSIVEFSYINEKLSCIRSLSGDGTLRYTDSLFYNAVGQLEKESRHVNETNTFFHKYTYEGLNKVSDTLFEYDGTSFIATQAVLFTHSTEGNVNQEDHFAYQGGRWSQIKTVLMEYELETLTSVSIHAGVGSTGALIDSLAFEYDIDKNRIKESKFNDEKALTYTIDYKWINTNTYTTNLNNSLKTQSISMSTTNRIINLYSQSSLKEIRVYDIAGRTIINENINNSLNARVNIPSNISNGRYIAFVTTNSGTHIKKTFTLN